MKKCGVIIGLCVMLVLCALQQSNAGEVDILVDKLVEKGVLSSSDAKEILKEVKTAAKKEREEVVKQTAEALRKDGPLLAADLPKWIQKTKFKGDLRLRYEFRNRSLSTDRHRGRYRLRAGFLTQVTDKVNVGFGLATGGNDPRSTNQTMSNSFDTPDIRLDYAYASYKPFDWLTVIGGKFKNPLWRPSDLLWDSDINPEGITAKIAYKAGSNLKLFLNSGFWLIDERSNDEQDPAMFVAQGGYTFKLNKNIYFKNAFTMYEFTNVEDTVLDHTEATNSLSRNGVLRHDYDALGVSAELGIKNPLPILPFVALFGDYVNNRKVSHADEGYLMGFKFGHKKVKKQKQWQVKAMYRKLERDAWLDIFPDSDSYGGATNIEGYEVVFTYGMLDNVILGIDYYYTERLRGSSRSENLLQVDCIFKF